MSHSDSLAVRALRREMGNVGDNLYRFRIQERADPNHRTGNGEPIASIIAKLEDEQRQLAKAIEDIEGVMP